MITDVHYANYGTGVTVEDVRDVEERFTDFCLERKVDFAIFGGDRFLAHNPPDEIRVVAEKVQKRRNDAGVTVFSLIGNHDWWAKTAVKGHSNALAQQVWDTELRRLVIMDEASTYKVNHLSHVRIHALPASFEASEASWEIDPKYWNICVFHDLLAGTVIDVQSQFVMSSGMNRDSLDRAEFDCVLGGDVHLPQKIEFKNTRGGYVGAPIQQSRRDRGDTRGWLYAELSEEKGFVSELVPSGCPEFVDVEWDLELSNGLFPGADQIEEAVQQAYGVSCKGNILDLVFKGSRVQLEGMPKKYTSSLQEALGARRINPPIRQATTVMPQEIVAMETTATPHADLEAFMRSGKVDLGGLDANRLMAKANQVLGNLVGKDCK